MVTHILVIHDSYAEPGRRPVLRYWKCKTDRPDYNQAQLLNEACTMYMVQWIIYSVYSTIYSVQYTLYTVYTIQCTLTYRVDIVRWMRVSVI